MGGAMREQIRSWCFDQALPFWFEHGLDRVHGGAVESLVLHGSASSQAPIKRVRVLGRQLYVFSHAALLGWPQGREASDHLFAYLMEKAWQGTDQGWPRTLDPVSAAVLDPTPDLYDYAFALFALGWRYKLSREGEALALAHRTLDLIDARFRHPHGGFLHELPAAPPRQQNPHMHLIEAAIVLAEATGEGRFCALAEEIAALFERRILRLPEGVLPEFFEEDWRPVAGEKGRWIEPGHQFEWAWILAQHHKLTGADTTPLVRALAGWAERCGVDPHDSRTYNGVQDDGRPLDRGSRTWPNTERMKGWLGLHELTGENPWPAADASAALLLERYLGPPNAPGGWTDAFDAEGRALARATPASTLYHVFLAFAEYLRLSAP